MHDVLPWLLFAFQSVALIGFGGYWFVHRNIYYPNTTAPRSKLYAERSAWRR
jgi:hypothetical protein